MIRGGLHALPLLCALFVGSHAAEAEAITRTGFLAGPTNLEFEWRSRHVYYDFGLWIPAVVVAPLPPPLQLRAGYRLEVSESWSLRLGPHVAAVLGAVSPYESPPLLIGSLDAGLRYEAASGFLFGVDVPLALAWETSEGANFEWGPWRSRALVQLYLGWLWEL